MICFRGANQQRNGRNFVLYNTLRINNIDIKSNLVISNYKVQPRYLELNGTVLKLRDIRDIEGKLRKNK